MKRQFKTVLTLFLAGSICVSQFLGAGIPAQAAGSRTLTLDMAKRLAVANSSTYAKLESSLAVKQVSLKQAVRSIRAKQKNMSTFRWSPLLSFKFPEKPDLSEAFEFQFKPIQIQADIDAANHKLNDQVLAEYEKVSNLYVEIVVLEDTIAFTEKRLEAAKTGLEKNRAKLKTGQAKQNDIDTMEKSVKTLTNKIVTDRRSLENTKKKLSTALGMDVSTGYSFENPFRQADISRSRLSWLIAYTLERDQNYYEVSMDAETSKIALRTNYSLMKNHYGSDINYISNYVNQALNGSKVNGKAFKKDYETFLDKVDSYWQGKKRILFIKIPRVWFKGSLDGVRYVEDEPYALYEAAMEYQDALLDKKETKASLEEQVEDSFNNYISMQNAYLASVDAVETAQKELEKGEILNRLGEMTYEEYKSSLDDYEDLQNTMFEALATYSQTLYSLDRLTCGGITALLTGADADASAANPGESYIEEEYADGAYYYIKPIIQEEEFQLGISLPEDFDIDMTHFELWCDNIRIGERTEIDKAIRHLSLSRDAVAQTKLRFYNEAEFVTECTIDADAYSGPLKLVKSYDIVTVPQMEIGSYTVSHNEMTQMVNVTMKPEAGEGIAYYTVKTQDGKVLAGSDMLKIESKFQYLGLVSSSLQELSLEFYDKDKKLLYKGYFETSSLKLMKNPEEP